MSYSKEIFSGVIWTSIQTIVNRSFSFIVQLILARILFPADFGIVGMATVFIVFVSVFSDIGMNAALVQKKEEEITSNHYHTAFWTGLVWNTLVYFFISIFVTKLAVWFYSEPVLGKIIPILSISILISPLNLVHKAQLTRGLQFKKLALINNIASISAGSIAIILALTGFGVMSLVFNSLVATLVAIPFYYYATRWKPKLIWDRTCFKEIFGFGLFTVGTSLFNILSSKVDYLIVGKLLGASTLGIYTFAFILTNVIRDQLVGIINSVMYPVYTKIQNDSKALVRNYLSVLRINNLIVHPFIVGLILFSPYVVPLLFGDKWIDSIIIIRILCVSVLFQMVNNSHTALIRASGRADIEFKLQFVKSVIVFVPLIIFGTYYYGIIGTSIAYSISKLISIIISIIIMHRLFDITVINIWNSIFPAIKNSIISVVIVFIAFWIFDNWIVSLLFYCLSIAVLIGYFQNQELKLLKPLFNRAKS